MEIMNIKPIDMIGIEMDYQEFKKLVNEHGESIFHELFKEKEGTNEQENNLE